MNIATNSFLVAIRSEKYKKFIPPYLENWWLNILSDDMLRIRFIEDFGQEMQQLSRFKNTQMLDNWRALAERQIPLSKNYVFLENTGVVNRAIGLLW